MKRFQPPLWFCALFLALALCWRMAGAPVTAQQFKDLEVPAWQARTLLPSRMARIWRLWLLQSRNAEPQMPDSQSTQAGTAISVYLAQEDRLAQMTLEGYVCGVVAAEMPARYHLEALKAQAVAARTRALAQIQSGGCVLHPGADICTDSAHCQGYATLAECRDKWGEEYDAYRDRILTAQRETRGDVITYDGELISVFYHAISGGRTEDAAAVFAQSMPYLVSVESAGEEETQGFWQDASFSFSEVAQALNRILPSANLTAQEVQRTFAIRSYTGTGRVDTVQVKDQPLEATVLRRALGLRSTWFSISMDENGITFHQRGYGHGVGMSQVGANSMAANGASYEKILAHYYPGVTLQKHE